MLENMPKDLKAHAYVLKRTNYGEADRILNLITPVGKISALAKGVRKPKSKLAGGIEMFSLVNVNLHFGKGEMAVLTGAKMEKFYGEILKDLGRMELAGEILKKVSKASDSVDSAEFFEIVDECLTTLDAGFSVELVEAWFLLNLARVMGEEINLYRDASGEKLEASLVYSWNGSEMVFYENENGEVNADVIKILRLMVSTKLDVILRIKNISEYVPVILEIAKAF